MWVSLLILPAAIAVLLLALKFIDSKRLRRSLQLAMILSLATHCGFVIFARQTSIFDGFFLEVNRTTTPVKQQRVLHVSSQVKTMPWLESNPTSLPESTEPAPEKQARTETSTARPQPSDVAKQQPTENPQLVRRQQLSETVPRLGKSVSRLKRQTENQQLKSSEKVALAQPAPAQPRSQSAKPKQATLQADATDLTRSSNERSSITKSSAAKSNATTSDSQRRQARNELAESGSSDKALPKRSREKPTLETSQTRLTRRESPAASGANEARIENTQPARNVRAPRAARQPESRAMAASLPSDAATMERRSSDSDNPTNAKLERKQRAASKSTQISQVQPERREQKPTITNRQPASKTSRATVAAATPTTPEIVERPRPDNTAQSTSGIAQLNPQNTALDRSNNGTSGVGRSANLDRNTGSLQSAAMTPSDSMRRREETTQRIDPSSLALRQKANVPRSAAAEALPKVVSQPDTVAVASRPATATPAELTASSSASLTHSDSDARRGDTSVAKGSGSVDRGPRKVVSEELTRRTSGGGQPEIQPQPVNQQASIRGDAAASAPSLATEVVDRVATDNGASEAIRAMSDLPVPAATADLLARRDGEADDSGAPTRSENSQSDQINSSTADMAKSVLGRATSDTIGEEDDEEERLRRERALALARSARRNAGADAPTIDSTIETVQPALGQTARSGLPSENGRMSDAIADAVIERSTSANTDSSETEKVDSASREVADSAASGARETSETQLARSTNSQETPDVAQEQLAQQQLTEGNRTMAPRSDRSLAESGITDGEVPEIIGQSETGQGLANQVVEDDSLAQLARSAPAGMSLKIEADTGAAGIGDQLEDDPGIDSRQASRDSPAIQSMSETRFRKQDAGGAPSINSAPIIAKEAFRSRNQPARSSAAPKTEQAIELGLAWLVREQKEDGSWTLHNTPADSNSRVKRVNSDMAATGLAILAFQGAGYNHKEFKYSSQLQAAISWMIQNQKANGELYIDADKYSNDSCRFYSHGIAALALAEAYGMTQDEELRPAVQKALDYIAETQHPRLGGWRYFAGFEADTSVTGWMMMAMQSGKLAELNVEESTWAGIRRWLEMARSPARESLFRYNPEALDKASTRHGRDPTPCMTSVGLLMQLYLGWDRMDNRLSDGADYILQNLPDDSSVTKRDTYYWYYATQIMRHVGGESWQQWHDALHPLLTKSQIKENQLSGSGQQANPLAGSWDPINPVPDRWGAQAGRLYVTTMNLLSLEVDYRLLPLYDDTSK